MLTYEEQLLGSAGTVRENWEWVHDQGRFWIIYTDLLTTANLRKLADFDRTKEGVLTMGLHRPDDPRDCGLASVNEEGRIVSFEEKSQQPKGDLAFAGMLLARPELIEHLPAQPLLDFGRDVFPLLTGQLW
jgi:mannose-1-phosphate guanylyltransferase